MLAKLTRDLPRDEDLYYEPKWDGFRCIVFRDGDEVELGSRNEKPLTRYFPELVDALRRELPDRCVLDGEIVIVGPERARLRRAVPAHPPGGQADQPARRGHAGLVRRLRPPGPRRHLVHGHAVRAAAQGAREAAQEGQAARPPDPGHAGPRRRLRLVLALRGRRPRWGRRQTRGPPLPPRQARHAQGEAPAHGRLRRRRLPHPQGRRGRGLAPARPLRRQPAPSTTSASRPASASPAAASSSTR